MTTISFTQAHRASRNVAVVVGAAVFWCAAYVSAADTGRTEPASSEAEASAPLDPVIIEDDGAELTPEQLRRKFGDALSKPAKPALSERRLEGGALEVETRFGRFCTRPMPAYLSSGVGGDVNLLAPCAAY